MPLEQYKKKRDFKRTPEPEGTAKPKESKKKLPRFVVQEHHATSLHWDFRLERDGVLVSWAVPKGIPPDPKRNNLAVHVEDHPLSYIDFAGDIPEGNYGAGQVTVWDKGGYEEIKWSDREVMVVLHGRRVEGRYVLFQTNGKNWMIHRMDPPQDAGREPMPERIEPMKAKLALSLPRDSASYGFEFKWDGVRAIAFCSGGRVRLQSRSLEDITARYPEVREMGLAIGSHELVLDGEVIAVDKNGRPSFELLQGRIGLNSEADIRRKMKEIPVGYVLFDLLYLDGHSTMALPYTERRRRLEDLKLKGRYWQTPQATVGDGASTLETSKKLGVEGVMAKRLDSVYQPGKRPDAWLKVKNHQGQELVIGGWLPGAGVREGWVGALLVGYFDGPDLVYAGKVGTGFTDKMLERLKSLLGPLRRDTSPFTGGLKPPKGAIFVEPKVVGEFEFSEWTRAGHLRQPSFKGLREDKDARTVVRELPA
ncbi:MAG: non-homologous end-joining DNA ligase [Candidatus Dormibacteraeota bacterium]|nr:non-homologous end-joining DNA ligase [Candidatus Dormibacteraeota bacterium]